MSDNYRNSTYIDQSYEDFYAYDRVKFKLSKLPIIRARSTLDLGGGKAQCFYALKKHGFKGNYTCIDNDPEMIRMARENFSSSDCSFYSMDCIDYLKNNESKFDLILCWGLLSFYDDAEKLLNLMFNHLSNSGVISLWGGFTENDYNVFVSYNQRKGSLVGGLNMHSLPEIISLLEKRNKGIRIYKYSPTYDIDEDTNNPLKSWTIHLNSVDKAFVNGLNIVRRFYHLIISNN